MIANSFFRALGDLFTNVLFYPYQALRFTDGWWASNAFNWILFSITSVLFIYWLGQLQKFKREGTE